MTKALLALGDGFNEVDASSISAALSTAGIEVVPAGIPGVRATGQHGITVFTKTRLTEADPEDYDIIIIPGGHQKYIQTLTLSSKFKELVQNRGEKIIASVGNGPIVLAKFGLLDGVMTAVHPKIERDVPSPRNARSLADKNIVTAPDSSCALDCGIKVVELLQGKNKAEKVRSILAPTSNSR